MSSGIPRRKLALYVTEQLLAGHNVTKELAAYLLDEHRTREANLIVRDVKVALADRGVLFADIDSASALSEQSRAAIADFLKHATGAKEVHLDESVDANLIGGVRIETPDKRLDTTLRNRLNQLTSSKI